MRRYLPQAFHVAVITFVVLWYLDWQLPGFVSNVFPLWIPLLVAVALGIAELVEPPRVVQKPKRALLVAALVGLLIGLGLFPSLVVFGDLQILLVLAVIATPMLLVAYLLYD